MKEKKRKNSRFHEIWKRMKKNKSAMFGLIVIGLILLISIVGQLVIPYEQVTAQNAAERLQGPSLQHWFGTDSYGRDVFARTVYGARISLTIGFVTSGASLLVGSILGAITGYYGGKLDSLIMRFMDVLTSIPAILLSLAIVSVLGTNMRNLLIAITISSIPNFTRLVRSTILTIVENEYVLAAKAAGKKNREIIFQHILPNAMGPIIVQATQNISSMILQAAGLSFIGMGVQPPTPEWGSMLSESREYMRQAIYLMLFPGGAIILSALSFNLIGDGLRDALDPKLKK